MDFSHLSGITGYSEKQTVPADSAASYGSGLVDVFSTPAMVAFAEASCMKSVAALLPDGHSTVGTMVHFTHEKATPIGDMVRCICKVIVAEGRRLVFDVELSDSKGIIGRGSHERYIIDMQKFMAKLNS